MIKNRLILALVALFSVLSVQKMTAQSLIPWLGKNGRYGYADESGKVVFEPILEYANPIDADAPYFKVYEHSVNKVFFLNRDSFFFVNHIFHPTDSIDVNTTADTIKSLFLIDQGGQIIYYTPQNRKQAHYANSYAIDCPYALKWELVREKQKFGPFHFNAGLIRVFKPNGLINLMDRSLHEIYPTDFASIEFAKDGNVLLKDTSGRMAIGDRKGRLRTGFDFDDLKQTGKRGVYIANSQLDTTAFWSELPSKTYLVNSKGKRIGHKNFQRIRPAGEKRLVARTKTGERLIDFKGKTVFKPSEESSLSLIYGDNYLLWNNHHGTIVDGFGHQKLPLQLDGITLIDWTGVPYLKFSANGMEGVMDANLNLLFQDTITALYPHSLAGKQYWHTLITHDDHRLNGIRDCKGKVILPLIYDQFISNSDDWQRPYFEVKKDGLVGYFDTVGRAIFPCEFEEIKCSFTKTDSLVFARKKGSQLYSVFNLEGQRLPLPDRCAPSRKIEAFYERFSEHPDTVCTVVFADGSFHRFIVKRDFGPDVKSAGSPLGGIFYHYTKDSINVFDINMKPILPKGFTTDFISYSDLGFEVSGLLPIRSKTVKDLTGLINAKGEWVMQPKKGSIFRGISPCWVHEILIDSTGKRNGGRLHRINHPNPTVFENVSEVYEQSQNANFKVIFGIPDSTSGIKSLIETYFSKTGEETKPSPEFRAESTQWGRHNLAYSATEWVILDEKAQVLVHLPGLERAWQPDDDFILAKKKGLWGMLDSMGQVVAPFLFNNLSIDRKGQFLLEKRPDGNFQLLDWNGNVLPVRAAKHVSAWRISSGNTLAYTNDEKRNAKTAVLSPKMELLFLLEGRVYDEYESKSGKRFYKMEGGKNGKAFWLDPESGKAFMEK